MFDNLFRNLDDWTGEIETARRRIAELWPDENGLAFCEWQNEQALENFQAVREHCDDGARLANDVDKRKAEFQRVTETAQRTRDDLNRRRGRIEEQARTFQF